MGRQNPMTGLLEEIKKTLFLVNGKKKKILYFVYIKIPKRKDKAERQNHFIRCKYTS